MHTLVTDASAALSRNDAAALEALCDRARALLHTQEASAEDRLRSTQAVLCFQRQVLAARGNVTLRQRLLAASSAPGAAWAR